MSLFNTVTFYRNRYIGSYVNGKWTTTATEESPLLITGSWQPATGKDLEVLPEGNREGQFYKGYTDTEIRPELQAINDNDPVPADILTYGSNNYKVVHVAYWNNGLISHYKFLVVLVKESV